MDQKQIEKYAYMSPEQARLYSGGHRKTLCISTLLIYVLAAVTGLLLGHLGTIFFPNLFQ